MQRFDEWEELVQSVNEKDFITPKDIQLYCTCPQAYLLQKLLGQTKYPKSAIADRSMFFFRKRRELFDVRDPDIGQLFPGALRAGPSLTHVEDMSSEELELYLNSSGASEFGNAVVNSWDWHLKSVEGGTHDNVVWNSPGERVMLRNGLAGIAQSYYQLNVKSGAPVIGYLDTDWPFLFEGQWYKVRVNELRPRVKDGKFSLFMDRLGVGAFKDEFGEPGNHASSALATFEFLALSRALDYVFYWNKFRLEESVRDEFRNLPERMKPHLVSRHLDLYGRSQSVTTRSEKDLDDFRRLTDHFQEGVLKEEFGPNTDNCDTCRCNVVGSGGSVGCSYPPKKNPAVPFYYFPVKRFNVVESELDDSVVLSGYVNRHVSRKGSVEPRARLVANMNLSFTDGDLEVLVSSSYTSNVFGVSNTSKSKDAPAQTFEMRLFRAADDYLQSRADDLGKSHVHSFDLLKFAGYTKLSSLARQLGYVLEGKVFTKRYQPA